MMSPYSREQIFPTQYVVHEKHEGHTIAIVYSSEDVFDAMMAIERLLDQGDLTENLAQIFHNQIEETIPEHLLYQAQ